MNLTAPHAPQDFLAGVHRPMTAEYTLIDLPVTGAIPKDLDGRYVRIGPNPVAPDPASYHWFIGDGMVHGVRLRGGRALWYRNRWIRSSAAAEALGETAAPGPRHGRSDIVNTNVMDIAGRTFGLMEAGTYPVDLSETLETQAYNPFGGTLAGSFTAHPHRDPLTGEHHAVCYDAGEPDTVRYVVIDPRGRVVREDPIAVGHGPMIHDCAFTHRFLIVLDLPVTLSPDAAAGGLPYRWNPGHPARVGLLPRQAAASQIVWYEVDPAFVFHVANAYDLADGRVALDVCAFDKMFDGASHGPNTRSRGLERWTIDPISRRVGTRTIDPAAQDFPRVDERRFGQAYRYVFTAALPLDEGGPEASTLYRHDLETGERQVHAFGRGRRVGEFVFTPRAPESAEGDGWLIGLVIDVEADTTDLVVLDATDIEGLPTAQVHLPHRVPPGFHGAWLPSSAEAVS